MVMPRLNMKKIQEILRLRFECGLSYVNIASSVNSKPSTVGDYIRRFNGSGIGWATAKELPESHLEQIIFSSIPRFRSRKPVPNWSYIHQELRKKSVTKQLLWGEYKANFPDGYQYTQFCNCLLYTSPSPRD